MVRINVRDNGIGIPSKLHHRLFGMFERIHPDLPYEGTGVGLAIVRRAATRMGGKVGVRAPEPLMDPEKAIRLAAWLVVMADIAKPGIGATFDAVRAAVEST